MQEKRCLNSGAMLPAGLQNCGSAFSIVKAQIHISFDDPIVRLLHTQPG